jgi:murein tripeptide amidase MpaA
MKFWLLIICGFIRNSDHQSTDGQFKLIRIRPVDEYQLNYLLQLSKNASNHDLDFWKEPSTVDAPIDIMVNIKSFETLHKNLIEREIPYNVTMDDVQKFIELQQKPRAKFFNRRLKDDSSFGRFNLGQYNSYADMITFMEGLQTSFPNIVQVFSIGQSVEQRQLKVIKIGTPTGAAKNSIWIDAGIHAREWIAPSTALYFINQLVTRYSIDPQIKLLVDQVDWYIMPLVNPDGYEYSRSSVSPKTRLWRKNRSASVCRTSSFGQECCQGVDLNRNFDFHWGENGASSNPCDEMYAGKFAFSEPETRSIQEFLQTRSTMFRSFITLHSYSQIWMYPYGHEKRNYPSDVSDLHSLAVQAKKAIQAVYGTKYIVGTGADTLYPASGGSDDWAKQHLNIKYSYLIELRPQENVFGGFLLDEGQILPTAKETFEGIKVVGDAIMRGDNNVVSSSVTNSGIVDDNCKNTEPQCGWWASLGACTTWSDMDKRCPLSCRLCDQSK